MSNVLLDTHRGTEQEKSSVHSIFGEIERALTSQCNVILVPKHDGWSRRALAAWIIQHGLSTDACIITDANILRILRNHGWNGSAILMALGDLPRGAVRLRRALPFLRPSDIVICNSSSDRVIFDLLIKGGDNQPNRIVLPFGIDTSRFSPASSEEKKYLRRHLNIGESDLVLLYVGRINLEKNIYSLLLCVEELKKRGHGNVRLVLCGDFFDDPFIHFKVFPRQFEHQVLKWIKERGLDETVIIREWADPVDYYKLADVFVNLTLNHDENFGLAQVEAMSCSLPVVCTAWGGLKDTVVDGHTGYLIDTWLSDTGIRVDYSMLLRALDDVSSKPEQREALGRNGRIRVEHTYSSSIMKTQLLKIIQASMNATTKHGQAELTEFGARFHERFSSQPVPWREDPMVFAPIYPSFADSDYMSIMSAYASKCAPEHSLDSELFLAIDGKVSSTYFVSSDPMWPFRMKITPAESEVLSKLYMFHPVPRVQIDADDLVLNHLIRQGLVGLHSIK